MEQIHDKFRNAYYHNLESLLGDLKALVSNTIRLRCKNDLAKVYLTNFLINAQKICQSKKKEFHEKWVKYYNGLLINNQINNCSVGGGDYKVWYNKFDESTKRQYHEINDYKIKVPGINDENPES